ncbi:MAG: AAA family ATPase, partial [Muribaculaceae bacterium]|nr:AAA family ATPase [Muribaculaceae bacterium]
MILKNIDILNFKNIAAATLEFSPGVNCLLGMNGMGKSNLLEAIHFLSMARPMTSLTDNALVRHGEEMLMVKGDFLSECALTDTIACGFTKGKAKTLKRNGKEYQRLSEHIGRYPVVTVTPDDSN